MWVFTLAECGGCINNSLLCRAQTLDCVERELKGWMKAMVKLSGTCFMTFSSSMVAVIFVGKLCSQNHLEQSACATTITDATLFPSLCGFLDAKI